MTRWCRRTPRKARARMPVSCASKVRTGRWCWLDPKLGAMHAVAEAARNVSCTGANPVAATNCLNFGNPEKPPIMWQFSQVVDGLTVACTTLETPITGGNVSLYNETLGEGIYPTPVLGVVGILENGERVVSSDFRQPGSAILLLRAAEPGDRQDAEAEFGSSEYAKAILGELWGYPPALELEREAALHKCLAELAANSVLESAHDCAEGGVAVALAESCFGRGVGAAINSESDAELAPEFQLFGEDASRVVVSCDPIRLGRIQEVAVRYKVAAIAIGETTAEKFSISA